MSNTEALSVAIYYHRRILEESCPLEGLSKKGAFIHMTQPMPMGSPLVIRFRVDDKGVGPALPCTVSHVEEISSREKTGRSGVDIVFAELEEDRLEFLEALVEGTDPEEAGAGFPDEPDFVLPEPPIPGEAIEPPPEPESQQQPEESAPSEEPEPAEKATAEESVPQEPEAQEQTAGEISAGEIGEVAPSEEMPAEAAATEEQPSVVVEAEPEQMELPARKSVSGEIGSSEPDPNIEEQPSVVIGDMEPPQETAQEPADQPPSEPSSENGDENGRENGDEDKPKKKKRRRGRRKKKSK